MPLSVSEATQLTLCQYYGIPTQHPPVLDPARRLLGCIQSFLAHQKLGHFLRCALEAHREGQATHRPLHFERHFRRLLDTHVPSDEDVNMDAAWATMFTIRSLLDRRDSHFETFLRCAIAAWNEVNEQARETVA